MKAETKNCQHCKKDFIIEVEDFDFYKKIDVPAPTFCPDCRQKRRLMWRNERSLYKRKCSATNKEIISMFTPDSPFIVYEREYWWSDKWDPRDSGRDYDFSKPFFQQYKELMRSTPLPNLANSRSINSEYGNHNADAKDCYWTFASYGIERVNFSSGIANSKDCFDLYKSTNNEKSYYNVFSNGMYGSMFTVNSVESHNSAFLAWCKNVNNSLGCVNLRNKQHYIFNEVYAKEDYKKERAKYDFGSHKALTEFREKFEKFRKKYPKRYANIIKSFDCTGDNIFSSKNCKETFDLLGDGENVKFVVHAMGLKDSHDVYAAGAGAELLYEVIDTGISSNRNFFTIFTHGCNNVDYVYACHSSSNLFGCVSLRNKEYCILNKQYSKEEYNKLVPRIKKHMENMPYVDERRKSYKYGEFFPEEISPFAYNESLAQEYWPMEKEEIVEGGYRWKEPEGKEYRITIKAADLPDHINKVEDNILDKVIGCEHEGRCKEQCTTAFKLIKDELNFYRATNVALPRLCPNCRHHQRVKTRNPLQLWDGQCSKCRSKFRTSYNPAKKEIVYCEKCYQAEVA